MKTSKQQDHLDEATGLRYSPLATGSKQLRLLTILPNKQFEHDIECLVHHEDLEAAVLPSYETISYVWGDPSCTDRLLVNAKTVVVPASATAALRRVRLHDTSRVVWLDAICINQRDEQERNQQVSMMGDVYHFGLCNLIYLGEVNIDPALVSVDNILKEAETEPNSFKHLRNEAGAWQYANTSINARFDANELIKLFSLPWFRRLWVLQEAALARNNICHCGPTVVELVRITRVAAWLIYKYYFVDANLRLQCSYAADMNDLIDDVYGYHRSRTGHPASVLYLLDLAQQRLSSVAADKVYGLLGLMAQSDGRSHIRIQPDYRRSTAEVYRQATWSIIESSSDLQVLDYVRHWTRDGELDLDDFSSWIPKWHRSKDLEEHPHFMSLTFDASLGRKVIFNEKSDMPQNMDSETLTISGVYVGTIAQTSERIKYDEDTRAANLHTILKEAEAMLRNARPGYWDSLDQELDSALAVTVCAGVDSSYQPAGPDTVQDYRIFREHSRELRTRLPSISECEHMEDGSTMIRASHFGEAMYNGCMNRKFFTTSQNHFGLGPHFLREGDKIAVLYGLKWPAVLRPITQEGRRKEELLFLGTAYCHGIMHGEAVRENDRLNSSMADVFRIR